MTNTNNENATSSALMNKLKSDVSGGIQAVEAELVRLREQRDTINEAIRLKVSEQKELNSALSSLKRKTRTTAKPEVEEAEVQPVDD